MLFRSIIKPLGERPKGNKDTPPCLLFAITAVENILTNGGRSRKKDIHDKKRIQRVEYELLHCRPCIGIDYVPSNSSGIRAKNSIDRFTYLLEIIDKEDGME